MSEKDRLSWTTEALHRLEGVPDGVMRDLTRQRVEKLARNLGESRVTEELMDAKYQQWADGSAHATSEMAWTAEARERMERIPDFVRGMVTEAVEAYARQQGLSEITPETVENVKTFWGDSGSFHRP